MSNFLSLFIFISSVVIGLVLMITGKDMRREKFLLLVSFHVIFLFAFIASLLLQKNKDHDTYNYFFMAFICSGIVLSGISWRSQSPNYFKIYFSIFALAIPIFLVSPSLLLNFLLTMRFSGIQGQSFPLDKYYSIETQNSFNTNTDQPHYKVILKKGFFHKTVQRDLLFGGKLDSIKVIDNSNGLSMIVRGYTSKITYVSSEVDSMDTNILLKVNKQGNVEYRL